jgi:hypothetical protein
VQRNNYVLTEEVRQGSTLNKKAARDLHSLDSSSRTRRTTNVVVILPKQRRPLSHNKSITKTPLGKKNKQTKHYSQNNELTVVVDDAVLVRRAETNRYYYD